MIEQTLQTSSTNLGRIKHESSLTVIHKDSCQFIDGKRSLKTVAGAEQKMSLLTCASSMALDPLVNCSCIVWSFVCHARNSCWCILASWVNANTVARLSSKALSCSSFKFWSPSSAWTCPSSNSFWPVKDLQNDKSKCNAHSGTYLLVRTCLYHAIKCWW